MMDIQQFKKCDKCKDRDAAANPNAPRTAFDSIIAEHGTRYLCAECWLDWSRGGAK